MLEFPLDYSGEFSPEGGDQPISLQLEKSWLRTATWAMRFAVVAWIYLIKRIYIITCMVWRHPEMLELKIIQLLLGNAVTYISASLLGYFCFQFGRNLKHALKRRNQKLLENAFFQLDYFLISGLFLTVSYFIFFVFQILYPN
ncbi:MAG: hypothetical protein ABIO24_01735 [Saprospiraceae bacterium]